MMHNYVLIILILYFVLSSILNIELMDFLYFIFVIYVKIYDLYM